MIIGGIDPGKKGGLTIIENANILAAVAMPVDAEGAVDFTAVKNFIVKWKPETMTIENVHAMPGNGVCAMFNFGFSTGGLHGVCHALDVKVMTVQPRTWQKALMGDAKHEKEDTIAWVMEIFPQTNLLATPRSKKPHDGISDSIGIAYWAWLQTQR